VGSGALALSVGAGAHASLELISDADDLPGHDDGMELPAGTRYVSFGIEATTSANLAVTSSALQFGASPSTKVEAVGYSRFALKSGITLLQAVEQTVTAFAIPACSGDLTDLLAGQIVRVAVSGKLELSGTADLLAITNPLASASLPAPLPTVSVSAGGSATIGVSCDIEAEYEIVAWKLDTGAVRLAWYHKDATGVSVTAKVNEGISAGVGSTDLFSQIVGVISADPKADLKELASAGVPDQQAKDIQSAVKAAASRKLEIAIASQFTAKDSQAATFLYEIVPAALTAESRNAIDQALLGNLSTLHAPGLSGIFCVHSIWEKVI
jgi:hypothetical protein